MTADFAQLGNRRKHLRAPTLEALFLDDGVHALTQPHHRRLVYLRLFRAHLRREHGFDLVRQFGQHFLLQAAHEERADAPAQILRVRSILIAAQERAVTEQIPRQDEVEDAPQFAHAVFQRRTRQGKARLRLQLANRLRALAARVFDVLRFV